MNKFYNFSNKSFKLVKLAVLSFMFFMPLQKTIAVEFKYIYNTGDKYRILSNVDEDVYLNRKYVQKAEIVNRISVEVTGTQGTSGTHKMISVTSEKTNPVAGNTGSYTWGEEYETIFSRDSRGVYTISDEYFMPVVRDIPVFPEGDIKPGFTWTYNGHEAHDFRRGFGIEKPYKIPFIAEYKYIGPEIVDGKELHKIQVEYNIEYTSPSTEIPDLMEISDFPLSTRGYSNQTIYWDEANGMPVFYNENFRIQMELASGNILEYIGSAEARVIESTLQRKAAEEDIKEKITKLLGELEGVENRNAKFVCCMTLLGDDGNLLYQTTGVCHGSIIKEAKGIHGFGYDPVFKVAGMDCTMAQMSETEKNMISHRANALDDVINFLESL